MAGIGLELFFLSSMTAIRQITYQREKVMTRKLFLAISNVPLVLSNCSLLFIPKFFSWSSASLLPQAYVQRPSHLILKVFHNVLILFAKLSLKHTNLLFPLMEISREGSYLFSNWSRRGCQISITCILRHLCFLLIDYISFSF